MQSAEKCPVVAEPRQGRPLNFTVRQPFAPARTQSALVSAVLGVVVVLLIFTTGCVGGSPPPKSHLPNVRDYYPDDARRLGITGRVGLEHSVDAKGRARNIVVVESAGQILDDGAKKMLSEMRFHMPEDWVATGGPEKRQIVGVIFELIGKPKVPRFEDNRPTIVITDPVLSK